MTVITTLLVLLLAGNLKSEVDGLIEAERAFARLSVEKGSRDAFLANLSDESILFRPGPVPGKQWMEKSEPVTTQLSWQREFADISSAADFGVTTGPWEFRRMPQESPAAYGHYVTVWKKPAGGAWKIAVDIGIAHMNRPKRRDVETPKLKSDVTNSLPEAEIQKARDELQAMEIDFRQPRTPTSRCLPTAPASIATTTSRLWDGPPFVRRLHKRAVP